MLIKPEVKQDYYLKYHDGTLFTVNQFMTQTSPLLKDVSGSLTLVDTVIQTCEMDRYHTLVDDLHRKDFKDHKPWCYFTFNTKISPFVAGAGLSRAHILERASPPMAIARQLDDISEQFKGQCENDCSDDDIRNYVSAWSLATTRNYRGVIRQRRKADAIGTWRMYATFWVAIGAAFGILTAVESLTPKAISQSPVFWPHGIWQSWAPVTLLAILCVIAGFVIRAFARQVTNEYKTAQVRFMNITRQDSLKVGNAFTLRQEKLARTHELMWEEANSAKEDSWQANEPKRWPPKRKYWIHAALWLNVRRQSNYEWMRHLYDMVVMGYAALTAEANFNAHYINFRWPEKDPKFVIYECPRWIIDGLLILVAFVFACVPGAMDIHDNSLDMVRVLNDRGVLLRLVVDSLPSLVLFAFLWMKLAELWARARTPDQPDLVVDNIKGAAFADAENGPAELRRVLLKNATRDAQRILIEEEKH
jgi:hypothetical protein